MLLPKTLNRCSRWLMRWRKPAAVSPRPLGLTDSELAALKALRSTPHWPLYLAVLEKVGEHQASELASGLSHDRYLFACGSLTALRRVFTLVDDLIASATKLEELVDDRTRDTARRAARNAASFVNTPWYDGWRSGAG